MFAVILLALLITVPARADLRDTDNAADYIILTNQEVLSNNSWINDLLAYREAQGRSAMAVTVEEVWAEFTPTESPEAVRDFLHYAYDNWQEPRVKDVFIVGHLDIVPTFTLASDINPGIFISDCAYSLADLDSVEPPLFAVGRLPWSPSHGTPLPNFLDKLIDYESRPSGECENVVQLVADVTDGTYQFDDRANDVGEQMPAFELERDFIGRNIGEPDYGDSTEITEHLSVGSFATFFFALSGTHELITGVVTEESVAGLSNSPCYSIYSGMTVLDLEDVELSSAMGAAVLNSSGGAIAGFGCTAVPWMISGSLFETNLAGGLANLGNATIGECYSAGITHFLNVDQGSMIAKETALTSVLLGDPATIVPGRSTSANPISAPPIPASVAIVGNYPNPFNPTTTVSFLLNRAGNAKLVVFDITGRTVATLADRDFTAGQHNLVWDAAGHASGMYLVRLEAAGQFDTHRITLLK